MAQGTIQAIQEAERETSQREKEARSKADGIVEQAKADAAAFIKSSSDKIKKEEASSMDEAQQKHEEILEKARQDAGAEMEALRGKAEQRQDAAIQTVLKELLA